jgi:alkaline phosphatase D
VTPRTVNETILDVISIDVTWTVATDSELSQPVAFGKFKTDFSRDFTIKVLASGLEHSKRYYYGFVVAGYPPSRSPVGTFRLPPPRGTRMEKLQYAIFSCANWGYGYFNAYDAATRYDSLDFWLHLGDFIYEYSNEYYPTPDQAVRFEPPPLGLRPASDCLTLDDYRERYGLYRRDPGVQGLSAAAPSIAIWDDHEIANNAWKFGAENQHPGDPPYELRKRDAIRAYHEWQPTRYFADNGNATAQEFYRYFDFGDLATLIVAETRLVARTNTMPPNYPNVINAIGSFGFAFLPPSQWNETMAAKALALKQYTDTLRENVSATITGLKQIEWMRDVTENSVKAGIRWQLFAEDAVMFNSGGYAPDFETAIKNADQKKAAYWQEAIDNLTGTDPKAITRWSSAGIGVLEPLLGTAVPVTELMRESTRVAYALGKYRIDYNTDNWSTYLKNRRQYFETVAKAPNAIIYGGDSHNAWAGVERLNGSVIAAEFDGWSVTPPGVDELLPFVPADLLAAGAVASGSSQDSGLQWADLVHRGFMLATLNRDVQVMQFLRVSTVASQNYKLECEASFMYRAVENGGQEERLGKGRRGPPGIGGEERFMRMPCPPVPDAIPYAAALKLNRFADQSSTVL